MIDMAGKQIIPAVIRYTTQLAGSISAVRNACPEADVSTQTELLLESSDLLAEQKQPCLPWKMLRLAAQPWKAERIRHWHTTVRSFLPWRP